MSDAVSSCKDLNSLVGNQNPSLGKIQEEN